MEQNGTAGLSPWPPLRRILRPQWLRMTFVALSSFMSGVVEVALLVIVTRSGLAIAEDRESLGVLAGVDRSISEALGIAALLVVVRLALALLGMYLSSTLAERVETATRKDVSTAFLSSSWKAQQEEAAGRFQQLLMGFSSSSGNMARSSAGLVTAALSLLALVVGSMLINPVATLGIIMLLVLLGTLLTPIRHQIRDRSKILAATQMKVATTASELGALGMEMQAFGVREQFQHRVDELIDEFARDRLAAQLARGALAPSYVALGFGALVGGLVFSSAFTTGEIGGIAAVMLVMLRSLSYGQGIQTTLGALHSATANHNTVSRAIKDLRDAPALQGHVAIERIGVIEATGVGFGYADESVLTDLDFRIEPGEIVGVVGPSGSGKSTLVQLVLGLREPTSGRIDVDGVDLHEVDKRAWATRTAFVAQDSVLVSGTIADNVRFFREGIDDLQVEQAAADAHVAVDIDKMPDGYDTEVGERGKYLSGGQRQRVSIARALAGKPDLLVMDEPTSALDARSDQLVRETIRALAGDVTVIMIAHRMSTLEICDRIMVLSDGKITAFGPADELAVSDDFYRDALDSSSDGVRGLKRSS